VRGARVCRRGEGRYGDRNGDLAIDGPDSDGEIAFAATALGNLRTRVMALPGNHDVGDEQPGQDPDQIIGADRLARWDNSFATDRCALDAGGWRLVGVNAQLFGSGLMREHAQDQWLDEQLRTDRWRAHRDLSAQASLPRTSNRRRESRVHGTRRLGRDCLISSIGPTCV
jgi:hypothetical protein